MTDRTEIDFASINAEVRALRAAEMRRLALVFSAWLRRVLHLGPAAHTA